MDAVALEELGRERHGPVGGDVERPGHGTDGISSGEGRSEQGDGHGPGVGGQLLVDLPVVEGHPAFAGQHREDGLDLGRLGQSGRTAGSGVEDQVTGRGRVVATLTVGIGDLGQLCRPARTKQIERCGPIWFAGPGGQGCDLGRRRRGHAPLVHGRFDVGPALGERPQDVLRDVGQLAQTVAPHLPAQAQGGKLSPQGGLVEGAGGLLPGVQVAAVRG